MGDRTANFTEIAQIGDAIGAAKQNLKLPQIPPGPFTLKNIYLGNEPELQYLLTAWPQLNYTTWMPGQNIYGTGLIPPSQGGKKDSQVTLDSNQTLVFFLTGALPNLNGPVTSFNGFSTNPSQPFALPNAGDNRKGPFLQYTPKYFSSTPGNTSQGVVLHSTSGTAQEPTSATNPAAQLQNLASTFQPGANAYPWLVDPYGMPYAYFAAIGGKSGLYCAPPHELTNNTANAVTVILNAPNPLGGSQNPAQPTYLQAYTLNLTVSSRALSLLPKGTTNPVTFTVNPFTDATGNFINPQGFQIISSGADCLFGPGINALYLPGPSTTNPGPAQRHFTEDDQANFSKSLLGGGIN
jgi:hypothetical protein